MGRKAKATAATDKATKETTKPLPWRKGEGSRSQGLGRGERATATPLQGSRAARVNRRSGLKEKRDQSAPPVINPKLDPVYLRMHPGIKQAFRKSEPLPAIALGEFLTPAALREAKAAGGWRESWVPDRYRVEGRGPLLARQIRGFVKSLFGREPLEGMDLRLRSGSYTILHDRDKQKPGIVAYLFLDDFNPEWGGELVFVKGGETLGRFAPRANTLLVVERRAGVRCFFKYVNHKAGKRSFRALSA